MIVNQNPYAGLVGIIVVLLVAGLVIGLAISNTDLVNPNSRAVESRARDLEIQAAAQKAEIDLTYYRAVRTADQEKLQLDINAKQRELEQNLRLAELSHYVLLGAGGLSLLIVSTGITVFLILCGRNRITRPNTLTVCSEGTWRDPNWRAEQIRLAREREHKIHQIDLAQEMTANVSTGGNGHNKTHH